MTEIELLTKISDTLYLIRIGVGVIAATNLVTLGVLMWKDR